MGNTTRANIPAEVSQFYDRTLLMRVIPAFLHQSWAQVRDIPRNAGTSTIRFRRYGNLEAATTPLTEGITPAGKQMSTTQVEATVAQYGDFVTITDVLQYESQDPVLTETAEVLGDQAGDTLDQITRDVLNAGTTVQYASTATARNQITAAMKLTVGEIREMVRTLKRNNAKRVSKMVNPTDGFNTKAVNQAYMAIVHPDTTYDLKALSEFIEVQDYPRQNDVMPDEVGAMDEVRFVESTNAKIFEGQGDGGIDVYSTLVIGREAYGVSRISGEALKNIIKPLGSGGTEDPLDQRATSGWKATFTAVILNNAFMGRIEHGASA